MQNTAGHGKVSFLSPPGKPARGGGDAIGGKGLIVTLIKRCFSSLSLSRSCDGPSLARSSVKSVKIVKGKTSLKWTQDTRKGDCEGELNHPMSITEELSIIEPSEERLKRKSHQ